MMNQEWFHDRNDEIWREFEGVLDALDQRKASIAIDFPHTYRRICQHLSLARQRHFGANLVDRLQALVMRGHQHLHKAPSGQWYRVRNFLARDFPRHVRAEWRLFLLSTLLLYGPFVAFLILVPRDPTLVYSVMSEENVAQFEEMYDPTSDRLGRPREAGADSYMFGFYIRNNIGVAFRTFAGGIFLGLGSLFFLVFNGIFMGVVAGHLTAIGYGSTFYPFVVGHGSFELTAIVLSGAAGMRMGLGPLRPGRRRAPRGTADPKCR